MAIYQSTNVQPNLKPQNDFHSTTLQSKNYKQNL